MKMSLFLFESMQQNQRIAQERALKKALPGLSQESIRSIMEAKK